MDFIKKMIFSWTEKEMTPPPIDTHTLNQDSELVVCRSLMN